jgi:hypothetical protein
MGESVEDVESVKVVKIVEAVALRPVGGWRSGPVRALRLEAPAYAKASAFVITSARQIGAAWGIGQRVILDCGSRIAD